jgi:hypothetical protein
LIGRRKTATRGKGPSFGQVLSWGWKPSRRRADATPAANPAEAGAPGKGVRGKKRRKAGGAVPGPSGRRVGERELLQKRDELARLFAELQWDLGGIAYEMAIRDHYNPELLNRQVARLREVDAQLGQIERVLKMGEAGAAGTCASCGALQARGAVYCWRCGKEVKPATKQKGETKPATEVAKAPTEANTADKARSK